MSQRNSGYDRKPREEYFTPSWVTEVLLPYFGSPRLTIWEPSAGSGKIVDVLKKHHHVVFSDITTGDDFLAFTEPLEGAEAIVTNPPFRLATKFIEHSLGLMEQSKGIVAMLLRTDFDHAKTRAHLFDHPAFHRKIVLRQRIRWFENSTGSPSFNHAWFIWNWHNKGTPHIFYQQLGSSLKDA